MITRNFDLVIRVPQQDYIDTGIDVVQNDQNVYTLNLRITDGITDIDYSQVDSATITFAKQDGHVVQGNLVATGAGFTYELGTNEIACPGKVVASIQLYGEIDERLTTARFSFEVVRDLITPSAVESSTEFSALVKAIAMMDELEDRLEDFPNIKVLGTYPTVEDLWTAHPDGSGIEGGYFVTGNGEFYIWSTVTDQWESLGKIEGPPGDTGPQGEPGPKGDKPAHQWSGTSVRFENPDGSWGSYVNLKGQDGFGAGDMLKSDYDTNNDGKVDAAEDADKLGGVAASLYALKSYVDAAVSGLVDSAPETLDTLQELAAALGNDPNFATTVSNNIGTKIPKVSSPTPGNVAVLTVDGEVEDGGKAVSDFMQRNVSQTMTAALIAKSGTDYTTKQVRNIILSAADAVAENMANGDLWIKYV